MAIENQPLKGRVALITGGSRGIGAGITRKLAAWGCAVCINYVDRHGPAKKIVAELLNQGVQASLHCADISEPAEIERLIDDVGKMHGQLNILVHNAAANKFCNLEESTLDQWDFVQNTNARSTWLLAKHALPWMQGRQGTRFITITNSTPHRITRGTGLFGAAKSSLEILTRYLSYELAPHGIVANCLRPGLVKTSIVKLRPQLLASIERELEISPWRGRRMTTVQDCGDAVAMLCLDEARWIAGQLITLDGGYRWWCNFREQDPTIFEGSAPDSGEICFG